MIKASVIDLTQGNLDTNEFIEIIKCNSYITKIINKPENNKITIDYILDNVKQYSLIYKYITQKDIGEMIEQKNINLDYSYIKNCDLSNCKESSFSAELSFFEGDVIFMGTNFCNGDVSFMGTTFFNGDVSFYCTIFGAGNKSFLGTNFGNSNVSFDGADFGEVDENFWGTNFGNSNVSFDGADFGEGGVSFKNSIFGDCNINFKSVVFKGDFDLSNAIANIISFNKCKFKEHVDFRFEKINILTIEDCIIEKILDMEKNENDYVKFHELSFYDTKNLGQIYIDFKRNNVFEAIVANKNMDDDKKSQQFKMLKENFKNIGYYEDEDKAFISYMDLKKDRNLFEKLTGCIGEYGTSPIKVLTVSILTVFIFGVIYSPMLINCQKPKVSYNFENIHQILRQIFNGFYLSGITFLTIGYGDITPLSISPWLQVLSVVEGFFGMFLMSYLTVAIVRKTLR